MKTYIDKFGNSGFITRDGTLRVISHYIKSQPKQLKYVNLEGHNGKKVSIRADKISEIIEMLTHYDSSISGGP